MKDGVCENSSCIINTTSAIEAVSDGINTMNISNNNSSIGAADSNSIPVCANCGKEGTNINNTCNKCKMVKYCNATCKKKHRHKHKKDCEEHVRLAAERAAKLHDEELFKLPPPKEDCPICFILLPSLDPTGKKYYSCCGKVICSGCIYAPRYDNQGNEVIEKTCPFCRTLHPTTEEENMKRVTKRVEANDAIAIFNIGGYHRDGTNGYAQDYTKALELYHRAAELGDAESYNSIGVTYNNGEGVEINKKKATQYFELAAMRGDVYARHNLGAVEQNAGNVDRALKHHMIAVGSGHNNSLKKIQELYSYGRATKEDYTKALQLYQEYLGEIKSRQRDEAAAYDNENYRYY